MIPHEKCPHCGKMYHANAAVCFNCKRCVSIFRYLRVIWVELIISAAFCAIIFYLLVFWFYEVMK